MHFTLPHPKAHLGSSQTSMMQCFCENSWQLLATAFLEGSSIDVWQGPKYTYDEQPVFIGFLLVL